MTRFTILLLFFALVSAHTLWAQSHLKFQHLTVDNGLSNNVVTAFLQDRQGFLWIGTQDGLNRYDGNNILIFRNIPTDSSSIAENHIGKIVEDREGNLWISTVNSLNRYNPATGKCKRYYRNPKDTSSYQGHINHQLITAFDKKEVWTATHNKSPEKVCYQRYDPKTDKFETHCYAPLKQSPYPISYALFEYEGELYGGGGAFRFDRTKKQFVAIHKNAPFPFPADRGAFALDKSGRVYYLSVEGTSIYNLKTQQHEKTWIDDRKVRGEKDFLLRATTYQAFLSPTTQTIWAATFGGLMQMNPHTGKTNYYMPNYFDNHSLKNRLVTVVYEDRNHNLWVGTEGGASYVSLRPKFYHEYPRYSDKRPMLANPKVNAFAEDENKNIYIVTPNGLNRWNRVQYAVFKQDTTFMLKNKMFMANDYTNVTYDFAEKKLYLATWGAGLHSFDPKQQKFEYLSFANSNIPAKKLEDLSKCGFGFLNGLALSNNYLWVADWGCGYGLNRLDKVSKRFMSYGDTSLMPQNKAYLLTTLLPFSNEKIFVGTTQNGLFIFDKQSGRYQNRTFTHNSSDDPKSLSNNTILEIFQSKAGQIWVGTADGLNLLQADSTFIRFKTEDGLPSNYICAIVEDQHANLWISTNQGISKMDTKTKQFTNYNVSDGLQGNDFNEGAVFKSSTGELFFGGGNGFNYFHPDSVEARKNTLAPQIVFTDLKVAGEKYATDTLIGYKKHLALANDENSFEISFAALDLTAPQKNKYQYRFIKTNDYWFNIINSSKEVTWQDLGNQTTLSFPKTDYGDYILEVRGSNADGVWNVPSQNAVLYLQIAAPFYLTKIFVLLNVLFFSGFFYAFYRFKILEDQKTTLTKKVKERTLDLEKKKEEIEAQRENLATLNQELQAMREKHYHRTVNDFRGLNSDFLDENGNILPHFQQFASKFLAFQTTQKIFFQSTHLSDFPIAQEIPDFIEKVKDIMGAQSLEIITNIGDFYLNPKDSKSLFYLIDELVRNAIKHAFTKTAKPQVNLSLYQEKEYLRLVFKDNGSGLPEGKKPKVLYELIESFKGTVAVSTEQGTTYDMRLKANLK